MIVHLKDTEKAAALFGAVPERNETACIHSI